MIYHPDVALALARQRHASLMTAAANYRRIRQARGTSRSAAPGQDSRYVPGLRSVFSMKTHPAAAPSGSKLAPRPQRREAPQP